MSSMKLVDATRMIPKTFTLNPPEGVFLIDGRRAENPEDTHAFCCGEYAIWISGRVAKRCVAAATETGFVEVQS